ncbi:hypothetical protein LOK49_Contig148G00007 [Camellia lanceoleosa]|nr:hypothetical protein LOK49_Contig148G00007 [Camellia lanceoleosa]
MVGSAKNLNFHAVLKLNYVMNPTIVDSLISGSLESLSSSTDLNYFKPVWILGFSETSNYKYSGDSGNGCDSGIDFPIDQSLSLPPRMFCSSQRRIDAVLKFKNECNSSRKKKNCTVLVDGIEYLPRVMSMVSIQCSEDERKVRFLIQFGNGSYMGYNQPLEPNSTLVAEASWDEEKGQLCIVACRVLKDDHVGDCSIRMSLRYPAFWSIKNRETIVGQIWTTKTVNEEEGVYDEETGNLCMVGCTKLSKDDQRSNTESMDCEVVVKFQYQPMNSKNGGQIKGTIKSTRKETDPLYFAQLEQRFGGQFFLPRRFREAEAVYEKVPVGDEEAKRGELTSKSEVAAMSALLSRIDAVLKYKNECNSSTKKKNCTVLGDEGVYDEEIGNLRMVGCTKLSKDDQRSKTESMDCEVVVKFQYQRMNSKNRGQIKGTIESMRTEIDALYFAQLEVSASTYYTEDARDSIW